MITFRYRPLITQAAPRSDGKEAYSKAYPDHYAWLEDNAIEYQVNMLHWPDLVVDRVLGSPGSRSRVGRHVCEMDVIIDDVPQAMLFRIYTGMSPLDE